MNFMNVNGNRRHLLFSVIGFIALLLPFGLADSYGESAAPSSAAREINRLGERIYREGILPSGEPLSVLAKGDVSIPGTSFACVSCHLRSGLGSLDEGVFSPPVNGEKLYKPLQQRYKGYEQKPKYTLPQLRPAYTDETLMSAIRSGIDPAGRALNNVMPRYPFEDKDMVILISYLKSLSAQFSPGASDTTLRFATVIAEDVRQEDRDAMLAPFEYNFNIKNNQTKYLSNYKNSRVASSRLMIEKMLGSDSKDLATKNFILSQWVLKGPPETWRNQLEEYNRTEPVFALLGGITNSDWKPIHQFSEDNQIPCIFPNTDFPVVSGTDWYTLYLSKGYYQEGESAARYLNSMDHVLKGKSVVQIVRDSREGKALSAGFQQIQQDLGLKEPVTVVLPTEKKLSKDLLHQVLSKEKPAVLVIWDDSNVLSALESLGDENRPEMVFVSSRYLGKSIWTLPENVRDITYITYPFAFSANTATASMGKQKVKDDLKKNLSQADIPLKDTKQQITSLSNALNQLLNTALIDMKGNYYRENLLDVIGAMMEQQYPLYGRIRTGPGQRYASAGCYIVQLTKGDKPELIKKSAWEIQ